MKKQGEEENAENIATPEADETWPSYTMVEGRMKKIYFDFYQETYKRSKIDRKTKELIAIAVALTTQCPYCIKIHAANARKAGATEAEIAESAMIAAALRAGAAVTHATHALE